MKIVVERKELLVVFAFVFLFGAGFGAMLLTMPACNGSQAQPPSIEPRSIVLGQPCPDSVKKMLVSRTLDSEGRLVETWGFLAHDRYYTVLTVADTAQYVTSSKVEY